MFLKSFLIMWILFSRWWCLPFGFALIASTTRELGFSQVNIFSPGSSWSYDFQTSVLLSEKDANSKEVGFLIDGTVVVKSIWENSNLDRLLKIELHSPKLNIRSGKAPNSNGFMSHTSKLESFKNSPFLLHWSNGKIEKILVQKDEPLSLVNLKKGIASLFQFQLEEREINEIDSSGHCAVRYSTVDSNRLKKHKLLCTSSDLPVHINSDEILNTDVESESVVSYELGDDNSYIKSANLNEAHLMFMKAKNDIGNKIVVHQSLKLIDTADTYTLSGNTFDEVVNNIIERENWIFTEESLLTERELLSDEEFTTFQSAVKKQKSNLKSNVVGTLPSAKVIGKLISIGKTSTKEDIVKTIGSKKNNAIVSQLYDLLGIIQTDASHGAAMSKLFFDDKKHAELSERYLWSLSVSPQPNPDILADLLKRCKKSTNLPDKVKETLVLTIAAMAQKLSNLPNFDAYFKIYDDAEEMILNGLDYSKDEDRYIYLRALKNLKSNTTIPKLLQILRNGTDRERVLAWKAVSSFRPSQWNDDILSTAITTFFQMDRKHDTSSRTLALDVILESKPTDDLVERLVYFLISDCKTFEVQQYLMQKMNMIAESNVDVRNKIKSIIQSDPRLNNYAVLAEKGLSTALKRSFLKNGTLVAVQEIKSGIVKRGVVDVVLEKDGISQQLFRLGIFTGGLSSFISSDTDDTDSDETATAGIELSVLGTQIRPFIFFNGQGELMGHVWSGTASEMTPAYQALLMPDYHLQYIRLAPGFICGMNLKGTASFDLSGKIELSLWSRNGVSLIKKSAGLFANGFLNVDTQFVQSKTEFTVLMEPKLSLETDLDFSSNISLCMRLSQPDFVYKHNIYKTERVPGSKHQIRKVKSSKYVLPGKTYSLNRKNNEMCNLIFKE